MNEDNKVKQGLQKLFTGYLLLALGFVSSSRELNYIALPAFLVAGYCFLTVRFRG